MTSLNHMLFSDIIRSTRDATNATRVLNTMHLEDANMSKIKDITLGDRFSRWTLVSKTDTGYPSKALFRCDCGTERLIFVKNVRRGLSKSCGCLTHHGYSKQGIYKKWCQMISRCRSPSNKDYPRYGGRGIYVCERWLNSFENYLADMGYPPPGTSIDRIDNDGPYSKDNCRWATVKEQSRNKRTNIRVEFNASILTLPEWSEKTGIPWTVLKKRLHQGWSVERMLTEPVLKRANSRQ